MSFIGYVYEYDRFIFQTYNFLHISDGVVLPTKSTDKIETAASKGEVKGEFVLCSQLYQRP